MEKPITMVIAETKEKLIADINETKLPAWVVCDILGQLYRSMTEIASQEAEYEKQQYLQTQEQMEGE